MSEHVGDTEPDPSQVGVVDDPAERLTALHANLAVMRRRLAENAAADPRVWSFDGTRFRFDVATDDPIPVGGYVRITQPDGTRLLGQITEAAPIEREGPSVSSDLAGTGLVEGLAGTVTVQLPIRAVAGGGPIHGRLEDDGRLGPPPRQAFDSATLEPASSAAVAAAVSRNDADDRLAFATLLTDDQVEIGLSAKGFGRHTFVCGQSGSGKTYSLGKLLEQLLMHTTIPIVALDPNSDYVTLTHVRDREETGLDEETYADQRAQIEALRHMIPVFSDGPDRISVLFGRMRLDQQATLLGLDPVLDAALYGRMRRAADLAGPDATFEQFLDVLEADADGQELARRARNLGVDQWRVWAHSIDDTIGSRLTRDWRGLVIDLGSVGSPAERSVVSAGALGWLWDNRYERQPRLIVIDEAHNVCPVEPATQSQAAAANLVRAIAAEGRKFGLYLLLSTQEPHKVHPDVLSQCANLILMRTTSRKALDTLKSVFSDVPSGLLDLAPTFTLGQGVVAGRIAPHPLVFKTKERLTLDGGRDVPSDWATARED